MKIFLVFILLLNVTAVSSFGKEIQVVRDPFIPIAKKDIKQTVQKQIKKNTYRIKLSGIIWDKKDPKAIIQFHTQTFTVSKRGALFHFRVTQISKNYIQLKSKSRTFILELGQEMII